MGLTYATSPMGADHTSGYGVAINFEMRRRGRPSKKEAIELSRNLQIATAAIDSTGLCLFIAFPVLDNPEALQCIVDMINARHGLTLRTGDVGTLGGQVLTMNAVSTTTPALPRPTTGCRGFQRNSEAP